MSPVANGFTRPVTCSTTLKVDSITLGALKRLRKSACTPSRTNVNVSHALPETGRRIRLIPSSHTAALLE